MKIRFLKEEDREKLHFILKETNLFGPEEISVAMELIDIVLRDSNQKDYAIHCLVDSEDQPIGYICYGRAPMTQGTYDLYWIAVHPLFQDKGIGSKLIEFLEKAVRELEGRMILVDTSSIPSYKRAIQFYERKGFQEVARVPDYYWPGNDRITYCKKVL